jgi:hypothetical protein
MANAPEPYDRSRDVRDVIVCALQPLEGTSAEACDAAGLLSIIGPCCATSAENPPAGTAPHEGGFSCAGGKRSRDHSPERPPATTLSKIMAGTLAPADPAMIASG